MKIVAVGDVLLSPKSMEKAVAESGRYEDAKVFFFGPDTKEGIRVYIKNMERPGGYECAPVPAEIMEEIKTADVLMTHMMPLPREVFETGKKLKIAASNRGGVENLNIEGASEFGVPLICNPAHNANAVAEMTIGMMIAETRNIGRCHASMTRDKKWLEKFPNSGRIHELKGSVIGIIGFGVIGKLLTEKLVKGFGSTVLVSDPFVEEAAVETLGARLVSQEELLREADIVSILTRASPSTTRMMGEKQFASMKPTAIFINTARAALADTEALVRALKNKTITGAAIDVYDMEPADSSNPLLSLDNVTLSCHKSGDTVEAFDDSPAMLLKQIDRFLGGGVPDFLLNPQTLKKG
jgi:D-3-phosphoglycerate dehydrogenase